MLDLLPLQAASTQQAHSALVAAPAWTCHGSLRYPVAKIPMKHENDREGVQGDAAQNAMLQCQAELSDRESLQKQPRELPSSLVSKEQV